MSLDVMKQALAVLEDYEPNEAHKVAVALVAAAERDRIADEAKHIIKRAEARGAASEREACAQVCESYENDMGYGQPQQCANAIRARGEK